MKTVADIYANSPGNNMPPVSCRSRNDVKVCLHMIALLFLMSCASPLHASAPLHHALSVSLHPAEHGLTATDMVTVPANSGELRFVLHAGLNPESPDPKVQVRKTGSRRGQVPLEAFTVTFPNDAKTITLHYSGPIYHPVAPADREQARGFDQTAGIITDTIVYLAGSSAWYPRFETDFVTFTLTTELPAGWDCVSQGTRTLYKKTKTGSAVSWDSTTPQEEIYLIASRFKEYEKKSGKLTAMVFLRTSDDGLANNYLDATIKYSAMYDKLIGPYPYTKFALVENYWETGFGMPSFTLLGPTVLRLPFIINTSYPHEILHNWWGNSVYPVYEKGNWSE